MSYDEHSDDAMFSRIIARLDQQAKDTAAFRSELLAILGEVRTEVKATNGRVRSLERWRDVITAKVAAISAVVSFIMGGIAWAFNHFL
jgi:hypothetical protein